MPPGTHNTVSRALGELVRPRYGGVVQCINGPRRPLTPKCSRGFASASKANWEEARSYSDAPPARRRWAETPERMRAPVSLKKHHPSNAYRVNEDQGVLDRIYRKILGDEGDRLLSDEVKWLAVTHKSFDQGRRGYNDRLAFLGKRIVDLQTSLALLNRKDGTFVDPPDEYGREPFRHPGVDLLPRLSEESKSEIISLTRIANLAETLGMLPILRWKPRKATDLAASGVDRVLAQSLYAIVGAVALERGGEVAVRLVRERVLKQLGLDV